MHLRREKHISFLLFPYVRLSRKREKQSLGVEIECFQLDYTHLACTNIDDAVQIIILPKFQSLKIFLKFNKKKHEDEDIKIWFDWRFTFGMIEWYLIEWIEKLDTMHDIKCIKKKWRESQWM